MSLTSLDRRAEEGKKHYQNRGLENHLGKPASFQLNSTVFKKELFRHFAADTYYMMCMYPHTHAHTHTPS